MTPREIQFLFTLRYNPFRRVNFKPRPSSDFISDSSDTSNLESILMRSIKNITAGKSKVAISFSSGVDSNIILTLLKKTGIKILCLVSDGPEVDAAYQLAKDQQVEIKTVFTDSVFRNIPLYVKMTGEPRWNVYHHRIAQEAKSLGYNTLLTGDGADELFGGYVHRYQKFMDNLPRLGFFTSVVAGHENDYLEEQNKFLKNLNLHELFMYMHQFDSIFLEPLERFMYADFNGKLIYDFIPTSNAISKYHSIEIKSPFLTEEVIDFALRLRPSTKISPDYRVGKLPLRDILAANNVGISDKKMGFTYDLVSDYQGFKRMIDLHPKTFDYINYDWFEQNLTSSEYRIINKVAQTYCLSEYLKLGI